MRIAICDDESADRQLLYDYIHRYDSSLQAQLFSSGRELLDAFQKSYYDLVFLDIEMDAPNGYEVGKQLAASDRPIRIVFTTKTVNYAVRGYGIAMRYLLKPIPYPTFASVLRLALDELIPERIVVQVAATQQWIVVADILYFEVFLHKVYIHMAGGAAVEVRATLADLIEQTSRSWFLQTHKSFCVNMDYIDKVDQNSIFLTDGTSIPIGSTRKKQVQIKIQEYLRNRCRT